MFTPIAMKAMKINQSSTAEDLYWIQSKPRSKTTKSSKPIYLGGLTSQKSGQIFCLAVRPLTRAVRPVGLAVRPLWWAVRPLVQWTVKSGRKTKWQIGLTFDSWLQTSRNLNHTFSSILGTYSNQRLRRSLAKFRLFFVWVKEGQKPSQNENEVQRLARGGWMIKMILYVFPHVTASKIEARNQ